MSTTARSSREPPSFDGNRRMAPRHAGIPKPVHAAFLLWIVAVAAGMFETVLAVTDPSSSGRSSVGSIIAGVAVRLLVFTVAIFLAVRMRQGRHWARVSLAVALGVFGTISLLIGPIEWLAEEHSVGEAFSNVHPLGLAFAASRGRNQVVNASPLFLSSSSSFSAGVFHPSVSRGRPLSLSAISSKSSR